MNILRIQKMLGIAFLIFALSLVMAACGSMPDFGQTAVNPTPNLNTQSNSIQIPTTNGEWDAATFYATTCASCHGVTGSGSAFAASLNQENIQTADKEWLIETISYGRPGTAMSAWSVESDGPLNSDQIAAMADFLQTGNWEAAGDIVQQQPSVLMGGSGRGMMGNGMMGGMNHNQRP